MSFLGRRTSLNPTSPRPPPEEYRRSIRHLATAALTTLGLALTTSAPAAAAPTPVEGLRWLIEVPRSLDQHLQQDCFSPTGLQWQYSSTTLRWGHLSGFDRAAGGWDPVAGSGSVAGDAPSTLFDSFTQVHEHTGHAWRLDDVGLVLAKRRAYVTARIRSARTLTAAAPRQRIAVIARPRLTAGVGHRFSRQGKDLGIQPNSFVMGMTGRAKVAPAFAAATARWRCKGRAANFARAHVRRGDPFGTVTVGLQPTAATGLGGTLTVIPRLDDEHAARVTVGATGQASAVTREREPAARFPMPAGTRIPLACKLGNSCEPTGGTATVPGGLVLGAAGRATTLGDLAVTWSVRGEDATATLTGSVDGQAMTIATGSRAFLELSDEARVAIRAALGTSVFGAFALDPQFTTTGPR